MIDLNKIVDRVNVTAATWTLGDEIEYTSVHVEFNNLDGWRIVPLENGKVELYQLPRISLSSMNYIGTFNLGVSRDDIFVLGEAFRTGRPHIGESDLMSLQDFLEIIEGYTTI